jgi:hypothetical protein
VTAVEKKKKALACSGIETRPPSHFAIPTPAPLICHKWIKKVAWRRTEKKNNERVIVNMVTGRNLEEINIVM